MQILTSIRFFLPAEGGRKLPIKAIQYRPDWMWRTGEQWCGLILPNDGKGWKLGGDTLVLGRHYEVIIQPFAPERWSTITDGQELRCCEANRIVGKGVVLRVLK